MSFDTHWNHCKANTKILAQDYNEMRIIYDLIEGSESYLEIGTSEGNSLYIFGHAVKRGGHVAYVDLAEKHTSSWREPKEKALVDAGYTVNGIHGDSHNEEIIRRAAKRNYDCVFIDAGHTYDDAYQDALNYGHLATKYIFFHDVQLLPVASAFMNYRHKTGKYGFTIVNSTNYGFGVIKV